MTPKDAQNFTDDNTFTVYDMKTADYRGILYNFNNEFGRETKMQFLQSVMQSIVRRW